MVVEKVEISALHVVDGATANVVYVTVRGKTIQDIHIYVKCVLSGT